MFEDKNELLNFVNRIQTQTKKTLPSLQKRETARRKREEERQRFESQFQRAGDGTIRIGDTVYRRGYGNTYLTESGEERTREQLSRLQGIETQYQERQREIDQGRTLGVYASEIPKAVGTVAGTVASPLVRIGQGTAEVIADVTGLSEQERQQQLESQQTTRDTLASLAERLRKTRDPKERQRIRQGMSEIIRIDDEQNRAFQDRQRQIAERTDPLQAAAAFGEVGLLAATGGIGGLATRAGAAAGRTASTAGRGVRAQQVAQRATEAGILGTEGAVGGALSDIESGREIGTGVAIGAGLGVAAPLAAPLASAVRGGAGVVKRGTTGLWETSRQAVKNTPAGQKVASQVDELSDKLITDARLTKEKYKETKLGKFVQGLKETLNVSHELRKLDIARARAKGVNVSKLSKNESLEQAYDQFNNYQAKASDAVQVIKDQETGQTLANVIQKYPGQAGDLFNNYRNAVAELIARGKGVKFRTALSDGDLKDIVANYERTNPEARKDLTTINRILNNTARKEARESGALTDELDKRLGNNKLWSPVLAAKAEDVPQAAIGGRTATVGEQQFVRQLSGPSDAPLDTSWDAVLNYVNTAYKNSAQARLSRLLLDSQKRGLIKDSAIISEPGAKSQKKLLRDYSVETLKQAKKLQRELKVTKKQAAAIEKEINELNKAGVQASVARGRTAAPKPTKTVTVKTVKPLMVDNVPKSIDELTNSDMVKDVLAREYGKDAGGIEQIAADVHNGGYTQLMALNPNITKATARSIATQILKQPTFKPGRITVSEGKIGREANPITLIKNMVDKDPADLMRIKQKIATREPKLAAKLDRIIEAQDEVSDLRSMAKGARQAAYEVVDDPTTGLPFIRGVDEFGQPYSMQLPPPLVRVLRGTDVTPDNKLINALLQVQRTFQTFWTGFANPVFNTVAQPFYDAAANVNALIDNPRAFVNSFTPDAFYSSLKGMKNSDDFQVALRSQGAMGQGGALLPRDVAQTAEQIISKRNLASRTGYLAKNPKELLNVLDSFSGKLGNLTRTRMARGYYKSALKQGKTETEALQDAAFAFNNIAPNFQRVGTLARNANAFLPYFTAGIAGNRSMWQPILANPGRAAAVYGGIATTFAGATAHNLSTQAGEQFYQAMRDSDRQYVLDNNYIIVLPTARFNEETGEWTGVIKIPIAPEFRGLNKIVHNTTQQAISEESDLSPQLVAGALLNSMTGGIPDSISQGPAAVRTAQILAGGKGTGSLFTPEPLIPSWMADLPKEEQTYPWTSAPAKFFSDITGRKISPIQADAIISQFGAAGQAVQGRTIEEQVGGKFTGIKTDTLKKQVYKEIEKQGDLSSQMRKAKVDIEGAKKMANSYNSKIDTLIERIRNSNLSDATKTELLENVEKRKASTENYALKRRLEG